MTKAQTRLFMYAGTGVFTLTFLALTVDSHRQFGELTNADQITDEVIEGKHVWHRKNCVNCHTLLGEGAYYAPDLTQITDQRGEPYLRAFLTDPSRFYSEERDRRIMPNPDLTPDQITQLIAFLEWVSNIDTQGWPPRPIRVTGGIQGAYAGGEPEGAAASTDPVAVGRQLFSASPPGCVACHSTNPGVVLAGPSMANLVRRSREILEDDDYQGGAGTVEGYVRESILSPSAYVVDGDRFGAGGRSFMPGNFGDLLEPAQVDALVAFLMTFN